MVEMHYGRFIADAMGELAARAIVPLLAQAPRRLRRVR